MKRYFSSFIVLLLSCTLFIFPINNVHAATSFKDVPSNHYAYKYITYLTGKGIIGGFPDHTFRPDVKVTRADMAVMLVKALHLKNLPRYKYTFTDVPKTYYAYNYIEKLVNYGYVAKVGKFHPEDKLTRAEMSAVISNTFKLKNTGKVIDFHDVPKTYWAYNYVQKLVQNNITAGAGNHKFEPETPITRAQFSIFLARALDTSFRPKPAPKPTPQKQIQVHYIDVGQGDAIYIKMPNGADVLIDGGNNSKGKVVNAYLHAHHVDDIEYMIATHPDADHIGGLDDVLKEFKVENVYAPKVSHTTKTYEDFLRAVKNEGLKIKQTSAEVTLPIPGVTARFVAPIKNYGSDLNAWSAVLHVKYNKRAFLFTGDLEKQSELDVVNKYGTGIKSDVLKVGHHGSKSSTSQALLNVVKPSIAVVSVGAHNRYGHPTTEVLNRLREMGIKIYRTDISGSVVVTSNGTSLSVKTVK